MNSRLSRAIALAFFLLGLPPDSRCQDGQSHAAQVERNVSGNMRDGIKLYANIYRPETPAKVPVVLMRTPYNKDRYDSSRFTQQAVQRGYAVIIQDVRGRFASEGEFIPYLNDLNDGYDSVEWAAGLPFSNGKVGMEGCSYMGAVQWQAAVTHPPHLAAIFPQCTFASARHFFYFSGAFDLSWIVWLNGRLPDIKRRRGATGRDASEQEAGLQWNTHKWDWLNFTPLKSLPVFQECCPYFYDWLEHPDDGPYWDFANVEKKHADVNVPAYNFTGWFDDGYGQPGAIRNYLGMKKNGKTAQAREGQKLIIGPWTHCRPRAQAGTLDFGPDAAVDLDALALRWFDYWLKGIDNGIMREPPIRIFVMGENKWRDEQEWPPARATRTPFYFSSRGSANSLYGDGKLGRPKPQGALEDHYTYNPANPVTDYFFEQVGPRDLRPIEARNDVLVYTSESLLKDMEVTGEITAELWASTTARDTDFIVKIADVRPDDYSQNITPPLSGIMRARYRESESNPVLLEPGKTYKFTIDSMYTSHVFKAGHKVRVWISSSYFPHVDRNPNTGKPFGSGTDMIPARQTIYHDAQRPSRIILPVMP